MSKKNSTIVNIIAILSLVIFGYLLFFTVYRQMISQNEGFFYVVVFGGILVLVYILLSLMTKLLAFSTESESNIVFAFLEILFVLVMSFLCVRLRTGYTTSVPAEESTIYRAALLINQGSLGVGGMDLFPQLLNNPQTFIMGHFLAFIFKLFEALPAMIIYVNTALQVAIGLVVYIITRRLSSRICSLLSFVCCLFMPSFGFAVYSYNGQLLYALILALAILFTIIPITQKTFDGTTVCSVIFSGIFWGLSFSMEPAGILLLIAVLIFNRRNRLSTKMSWFIVIVALFVFFILAFIKSLSLELSFGEILNGFISSSNPFISESGDKIQFSKLFENFNSKLDSQQKSINDNYYFLTANDGSTYSSIKVAWLQLGNQVLYMFIIILSIACSFYMIRSRHPRAIPILSSEIASFFMIFLCSGREYNILFFITLLLISGALSLQYMYVNHHALADESLLQFLGEDIDDDKNEETEEHLSEVEYNMFMLRAQALVFIGVNENYYQQIKDEERMKKEQIIAQKDAAEDTAQSVIEIIDTQIDKEILVEKNKKESNESIEETVEILETPLPMPPKHVSKELDYDKSVDEDDFDFDFDTDDDNMKDFDVE